MSDFQIFDPLSDDEYRALKKSIAKHGVMQAVITDEAGNVIDGHHRVQACTELGIDYPTEVIEGLTDQEKLARVLVLNVARRQLTKEQKRDAVLRLRELGMSVRNIATETGIPRSTVQRYIKPPEPSVPNGTPSEWTLDERLQAAYQKIVADHHRIVVEITNPKHIGTDPTTGFQRKNGAQYPSQDYVRPDDEAITKGAWLNKVEAMPDKLELLAEADTRKWPGGTKKERVDWQQKATGLTDRAVDESWTRLILRYLWDKWFGEVMETIRDEGLPEGGPGKLKTPPLPDMIIDAYMAEIQRHAKKGTSNDRIGQLANALDYNETVWWFDACQRITDIIEDVAETVPA